MNYPLTIGEVSKKYDVPVDTLRYYEKAGLIPYVAKNRSGLREYSEEACRWVVLAKCMRAAGMSVSTLAEYVRLFQLGDETLFERQKLLTDTRAELEAKKADLQAAIDRLDVKLGYYDEKIEVYLREGKTTPNAEKDI